MTSCFVHALLQEKHDTGSWTPSLSQQKPADKQNGTSPGTDPHTQSRLLTKKQLSDMAYGIRELSKRLGHVRLKLNVRNVFLLTKAHDVHLIENTRHMSQWLLDQNDAQYTV